MGLHNQPKDWRIGPENSNQKRLMAKNAAENAAQVRPQELSLWGLVLSIMSKLF